MSRSTEILLESNFWSRIYEAICILNFVNRLERFMYSDKVIIEIFRLSNATCIAPGKCTDACKISIKLMNRSSKFGCNEKKVIDFLIYRRVLKMQLKNASSASQARSHLTFNKFFNHLIYSFQT